MPRYRPSCRRSASSSIASKPIWRRTPARGTPSPSSMAPRRCTSRCLLAGVEPGDEVLVPALTFVATTNAVAYCGAIPHFVDSEERTLGHGRRRRCGDHLRRIAETRDGGTINRATGRVHPRRSCRCTPSAIRSTSTRSLAVARDFDLARGRGCRRVARQPRYHGRHTGTFGSMGTLSFNGNKTVTTGGGGAILTNDAELARRAKHLTTTAKAAAPLGVSCTTRSASTTACPTSMPRSAAPSSSSCPVSSRRSADCTSATERPCADCGGTPHGGATGMPQQLLAADAAARRTPQLTSAIRFSRPPTRRA